MIVGHVSRFFGAEHLQFFLYIFLFILYNKKRRDAFCEGRKLYEKNFEKRNSLYIIHAGIAARLAVRDEWFSSVGIVLESGNHHRSDYRKRGTSAGMGAVSVSGI